MWVVRSDVYNYARNAIRSLLDGYVINGTNFEGVSHVCILSRHSILPNKYLGK